MICIIAVTFYFYMFLQKGILFEGAFLTQNEENEGYLYSGIAYGETVKVKVDNDIKSTQKTHVTYYIGNRDEQIFSVIENNITSFGTDISIYNNGALLFEGTYRPSDNNIMVLWDKDGNPVSGYFTVTYNGYSPFGNTYNISNSHIISTAYGDNVIIRGNLSLFALAMLLLLLTAVDMKWPLFFFLLRHSLSVDNPEPSDLFVFIQKITWVIYPVIAVCILIASLFIR